MAKNINRSLKASLMLSLSWFGFPVIKEKRVRGGGEGGDLINEQ